MDKDKVIQQKKEVTEYLYFDEYLLLEIRFISLLFRMGNDGYFSEDFTDEELNNKFQVITIPSLFVFSLKDQFVPIDSNNYLYLINRIKQSNDNISIYTFEDNHQLSKYACEFIKVLSNFFEN